jgi:putative PIN family toxin of toxin-antitoxin system
MMIVLETNVIISGVLRPFSKPASILRMVADGTVQLAYDLRLISEYRDILSRPQFNISKDNREIFLTQIEQEGFLVSVKPLKMHLPDPDDEPFLEVALAGKVEAIVTGNKRHFPKQEYEGVKIVSPTEFLELLRQKA